jgi:hypothetical protein
MAAAGTTDTRAQPAQVAAFYHGRTVQAIVGYTPGSTFEIYLRAFIPAREPHQIPHVHVLVAVVEIEFPAWQGIGHH